MLPRQEPDSRTVPPFAVCWEHVGCFCDLETNLVAACLLPDLMTSLSVTKNRCTQIRDVSTIMLSGKWIPDVSTIMLSGKWIPDVSTIMLSGALNALISISTRFFKYMPCPHKKLSSKEFTPCHFFRHNCFRRNMHIFLRTGGSDTILTVSATITRLTLFCLFDPCLRSPSAYKA